MTDQNLSVIQLVIDRSGSMIAIADDADGSINAFIKQQKAEPGQCLVRFTHFDNNIDVVHELTDISNIPPYSIAPRGGTALYDAMGKSITELGEKLSAMPENERPGTVIFVTVTDGKENASQEFKDPDKLKELITKQTDQFNWQFLFLAAGQDAVLTGQRIGIRQDRSMTYTNTSEGVKSTFSTASAAASVLRSGVDYSITDEDRKNANGGSKSSSR